MINNLLFGVLALFWGGSFIAIKALIHDVPSFTAAFYRVFFALLFLVPIFFKSIKFNKELIGKELVYTSLCGLFSIGIPFSLLFWAEQFIAPSIASILNGTVPFWTVILSLTIFKSEQPLTKKKLIGLISGFSGIALIFGPKVVIRGELSELYGLCALLAMALFYSLGINLNQRLLSKNKVIDQRLSLIIQHIISVIYLGSLVLKIDGVPDFEKLLITKNALAVIYLSLFSTTIAFIIFFKLIREVGPMKASTVTFFVPAVALILDMIIFKRTLAPIEIIGVATIFTSMKLLSNPKKIIKRVNM